MTSDVLLRMTYSVTKRKEFDKSQFMLYINYSIGKSLIRGFYEDILVFDASGVRSFIVRMACFRRAISLSVVCLADLFPYFPTSVSGIFSFLARASVVM